MLRRIMPFGIVRKLLFVVMLAVLVSSFLFLDIASANTLTKKKRKSIHTEKSRYQFAIGLDTTVGLDEDKNLSNDLNLLVTYLIDQHAKLHFAWGITKIYPETIGPNESEFFINEPRLTYLYDPKLSFNRFYWKSIFSGIEGTSNEAYQNYSRLFSVFVGNQWGIKILDNLNFEHKLIVNKYFNKYENGPRGTYVSYDLINGFDLNFYPLNQLMLGLGISFIHNKTYGRAIYLTRVYGLYGEYTFPKDWSVGLCLQSSDDYSGYSREKLELYNRNNSSITLSIGKSF